MAVEVRCVRGAGQEGVGEAVVDGLAGQSLEVGAGDRRDQSLHPTTRLSQPLLSTDDYYLF